MTTKNCYEWTAKDKVLYAISLVPLVAVFVMTAIILNDSSVWLMITLFALYILVNFFQAGCCIGCPYRGRYCPALCGVYLGNFLSTVLYKNRTKHDPKFFKINATFGETILFVTILFPVYWVYLFGWIYLVVCFVLITTHFLLFMSTQCGKCSYNDTCPGGKMWCGIVKKC
ncbi:MAG: hypothetical protein R2883_08760 [Caldisericia bacterium]